MRWTKPFDDGWRKRFAIIPVKIGDEVLWLEWFERRFMGEYYEVRKI